MHAHLLVLVLISNLCQCQSRHQQHPYSPAVFLQAAQISLQAGEADRSDESWSEFEYEADCVHIMKEACQVRRLADWLLANGDYHKDTSACVASNHVAARTFAIFSIDSFFVKVDEVTTTAATQSPTPWSKLCLLAGVIDKLTVQLDMLVTERSHAFASQYHGHALRLLDEFDQFFRAVQAQGACGEHTISERDGDAPMNIEVVALQLQRMAKVMEESATPFVVAALQDMNRPMLQAATQQTLEYARKLDLLNYALNNVRVAFQGLKTSHPLLYVTGELLSNASRSVANLHAIALTKRRNFSLLDAGYVLMHRAMYQVQNVWEEEEEDKEEEDKEEDDDFPPKLAQCAGKKHSHARDHHPYKVLSEEVTLWNGVRMPRVAFGTAHEGSPVELFFPALDDGYRHFDLAQGYGHMEQNVGRLLGHLEERGLKREDLFLTSKLTYMVDFKKLRVRKAVEGMLRRLRCKHLDLLLLHSWQNFNWQDVHEAWSVFEELYDEGLVRAIGLSNVEVGHLEWLLPRVRIKPMVVQNLGNVFHPHDFIELPDVVQFCLRHDIVVSSYSSIATSERGPWLSAMQDAHVMAVAKNIDRSPGEVALHWALRRGGAVVTQSRSAQHRRDNLHIGRLPMLPWHHAYLDMIAPMYHCQQQNCGAALPGGDAFVEFQCGTPLVKDEAAQLQAVSSRLMAGNGWFEDEQLFDPLSLKFIALPARARRHVPLDLCEEL